MSSKISSVVFSAEFLRSRIATKLGDASRIEDRNVEGVARGLDLLPTADVGTYTTQKGKAGMYLVLDATVPARFGDGSVFTRIGEADEAIDLSKLQAVRDATQQRLDDLDGVMAHLAKENNSEE